MSKFLGILIAVFTIIFKPLVYYKRMKLLKEVKMKSLFIILCTLIIITFSTITFAESIFRSTPLENLTKKTAKTMIRDNNFFEKMYNDQGSGFHNDYEVINSGKVVHDRASGLMWQQSGSKYITYEKVKSYIKDLNQERFEGYSNWRLPTLEEAMSLMEPMKNSDELHIDKIFDDDKDPIWTSDTIDFSGSSFDDSNMGAWAVHFFYGEFMKYYIYVIDEDDEHKCVVRAVRSVK